MSKGQTNHTQAEISAYPQYGGSWTGAKNPIQPWRTLKISTYKDRNLVIGKERKIERQWVFGFGNQNT